MRGGARGTVDIAADKAEKSGGQGGLTKAQIDQAVRARQGLIRACCQRELSRTPGLSGKVVTSCRVVSDGHVKSARVLGDRSTLRDKPVQLCIMRQLQKAEFPPAARARR